MKYVLKFPERNKKYIAEEYARDVYGNLVLVDRFEITDEVELSLYNELSEKVTNRTFKLYEALEIAPEAVTFAHDDDTKLKNLFLSKKFVK